MKKANKVFAYQITGLSKPKKLTKKQLKAFEKILIEMMEVKNG